MRLRNSFFALAAVVLSGALFAAWERMTYDGAAWIEDYDSLRMQVSRDYANLLWVIEERGLDPAELHRTTLQELHDARTDRAARKAVASFVAAFQDGHFRIDRTPLSRRIERMFATEAEDLPAGMSAKSACAALGFSADEGALTFSGPELKVRSTPGNSFPSATFDLAGRTAGLLRIPIFDQMRYRGACERAWPAAVGAGRCDKGCVEHFVETSVPNQLLNELASQVRDLNDAGAQLLVVDVTGNGGGTDWAEPAARILSRTPLACAPVSFVKGPHWLKAFSDIAQKIDADLEGLQNPADITVLQAGRRRAVDLAARAGTTCALEEIWTKGGPAACSNLVSGTEYSACGLLGPLPKNSLANASSRSALYQGLGYAYDEGAFTGPVVLAIDGGTASAAEYFAAILADNDAAAVVGQRSFGVGCGYTNGGVSALLPHSGLKVRMPDCQRLRRDGSNEMAGVEPHLGVAWERGDDANVRWRKLVTALVTISAK